MQRVKRKGKLAVQVIHDENCPSAELDGQLPVNLYSDAAF